MSIPYDELRRLQDDHTYSPTLDTFPKFDPLSKAKRLGYFEGDKLNSGFSPEDTEWNNAHPNGYGLVDAPSPFGYNRDTFNAQHPGYTGGFYNPATGFYNAPVETRMTFANPQHLGNAPTTTSENGGASDTPQSSNDILSTFAALLDAISQFNEQRDSVQGESNGQ